MTAQPKLQLAMDALELTKAFGPLAQVQETVDVIEVGTVLLLGEGLRAVREVRALYPEATILADARIAEAGSVLAPPCFEAGANWISCVAGASLTTIAGVVAAAQQAGGQVQVELGEAYDPARAAQWRDLGVQHVIVKRSRDRESAGDLTWGLLDLDRINELAAMGFTVTVTGGIKAADLDVFAGAPVGVVIAGRSIMQAADPRAAAAELKAAIGRVWP
ncbi:MAG: orotidine 5'-phosphate decarboxylase [Bifidobacteriaceae bacterium]|jgi:3-dehydro-L-gulonate-6-phosphate decarboxylase|nr:orotidine 5'-phosphate decarboxylase [Bifidobacteriaceae bacterium]